MNAAQETAQLLLKTGCVNIRPGEPFTLTSGRKSPVYVDCRRLIGFKDERRIILNHMADLVRDLNIDICAGGETAGIPYGAWLSELLDTPMVYIRKKPKGFGRNAQIEGYFEEGQHALLVEDLATDGGSKIAFVEVMRTAGLTVKHTVVVFNYGLADTAYSPLAKAGIQLHGVTTWNDVLQVAADTKALDNNQIDEVRLFLDAPGSWEEKYA